MNGKITTHISCLIAQGKEAKEPCRGGVCIGFHNEFVVCKNLAIAIISLSDASQE